MPVLLNKLQRLASMGAGEVSSRLGQELAKRLDSLGLFQPAFKSLPTESLARTGRFFFDAEDIPQRLSLIRGHVADFETNILAQADRIMNHQFPLLGYGFLDYGQDIDWQLDIVNGKRAPLKPWPKIGYLDFHEAGDSKVTWELSRHQFLPTLAKAWLLTGDERLVRKLEQLYYDWQRKNPYPLGINWASSLEVAFRSLAWVWVWQLLSGCASAAKLRLDILQALAFNAWYIRRYLSTYFSPNTHLQGEAVALYFIGTLLPSLPAAKDWRETSWKVLLEHTLAKVLEDGAYFEQSTYYHVYALDFFLHARILAERNGDPFPGDYDGVLRKMLGHLACLCQAGPPPRFGDDDGGRVFDGRRNLGQHLADPLATGTALYRCADFKQPGVEVTEEMLWLLGEEGLEAFSGCPASAGGKSARFDHAGLYVAHGGKGPSASPAPDGTQGKAGPVSTTGSAWAGSRSQLVFDAGPLGGGSGGHGHADALSLVLNLDGKPLLIDPGACNYVGPGSDREDFRVTQADNTVTVDGLPQTNPKTAFSWFQWPKVIVEAVTFTPEFAFIAAAHDGYTRLQSPVTHRRTLFAPYQGFWFVLDELASDGPHDYALRWHLAPGADARQEAEGGWGVGLEGSKLHILAAADGWISAAEPGWFSPAYGVKQAAPVIGYAKKGAVGKEAIATVLWDGTSGTPAPTLVSLGHSSAHCAYRLTHGDGHLIFIVGDGLSVINIDGWETDARFLCGMLDSDGQPLRVTSVRSNVVRYRGDPFHGVAEHSGIFLWGRESQL